MKDITLVIPAKFESDSLPKVLNELKKFSVKKIIVIPKNDILTFKSVKKYNCKIIFQKKNGYGSALSQGILSVKTKYFCIFNADVWGYQKYNSGYGFQLFNHPLPYFNYLKFNLVSNAYMGNAFWWSYLPLTLNRFFPPLSLFLIFIFFYIWILLPKNLITWLTLPYLIIHILIPHKELRFMFPIFAFFPFAIGYVIDDIFIKRKLLFNIANKRITKKIFYFLFVLNILGLVTIFVPANSSYRFYKNFFELDNINHFYYFNDRLLESGEQKNPFYEGDQELHFYNRFEYIKYDTIENEQIENTIAFKKITEIDKNTISSKNEIIFMHVLKNSVNFDDLNNGEYWIIVSQWDYIKKLIKLDCSIEFASFPSWVFKININNWLSRTDIKTMFKCNFN